MTEKKKMKKQIKIFAGILLSFTLLSIAVSCKNNQLIQPPVDSKPDTIGMTLDVVNGDVLIVSHATKINQLTGEKDLQRNETVLSQTQSRYRLDGTDLGVPVADSNGKRTWLFFGDTWGGNDGLTDALGYSDQANPDGGLKLDFVSTTFGVWKPIYIKEINRGGFEVPAEGIMIGETMYLWHTTDHSETKTMGRSVLAKASRAELNNANFTYLYDFSSDKFINLSVVRVKNSEWPLLPQNTGEGIVIFGSGTYRSSHVFMAYQPLNGIENKSALRYFAGVKNGKPVWIKDESKALTIFNFSSDPRVGELSVSFNEYLKRWILLYNHDLPRGINLRTAQNPWGPWSEAQVVFRPWEDNGYCHFMHTSWEFRKCDNVMEPSGRTNEWGGEYGPYQFENFAKGDAAAGTSTIYFTMSTWNPYQVVLMQAVLKIK